MRTREIRAGGVLIYVTVFASIGAILWHFSKFTFKNIEAETLNSVKIFCYKIKMIES